MEINGEKYPFYNDVQILRMIYVENIGYFQLHEVIEESDGVKSFKQCKAISAQCTFATKRITGLEGDFKLFDPIKPTESLMGYLLTHIPGWKIGTVDGAVLVKHRTINVTDKDLYSFMTNDLYTAYECIFVFDYNNFLIHIYDAAKTFPDTEIYLSYHNLLKETTITPQTSNIVTALTVIGGDGLDIRGVNPNGTNTIYNVNYFKNRMTIGLQQALATYERKYENLRPVYSNLLLTFRNTNIELARLKNNAPSYTVDFSSNQDGTIRMNPSTLTNDSGLSQLEGLRKTLEDIRAIRIKEDNTPYTDVNNIIRNVDPMIVNKKAVIATTENKLKDITKQLTDISNQLRMENNFTDDQWIELNGYFIYDTVQENSFITTDIMTQEEIQAMQDELFAHGRLILEKACVPKYMFEISSVNFLALIEFQKFNDQFRLGSTFTLNINDDYIVKPLALGVHINFNDLSDFKLKFGTKTHLDEGFDLSGLANSIDMGSSISFDKAAIDALKNQRDEVA